MGPVHFGLIFVDIFAYDVEVLVLIADLAFTWFNFYNYMTLNKIIIIVHLMLLVLAFIVSISHF